MLYGGDVTISCAEADGMSRSRSSVSPRWSETSACAFHRPEISTVHLRPDAAARASSPPYTRGRPATQEESRPASPDRADPAQEGGDPLPHRLEHVGQLVARVVHDELPPGPGVCEALDRGERHRFVVPAGEDE